MHFLNLLLGLLCATECGAMLGKVAVTEVTVDSPIEDVVWLGHHNEVVLSRTAHGSIYRSEDGGRSWKDITSQLNYHDAFENMIVNPVDKRVVVIIGNESSHYISEDAGHTFRRIEFRQGIHHWVFNPKHRDWALFSHWTPECMKVDDDRCSHNLMFTTDLGRSSSLVSNKIVQFQFGSEHHSNKIFFTHHSDKKKRQPRGGGWASDIDFAVKEVGAPSENLLQGGNKFLLSGEHIFVAQALDPLAQTVKLMISRDEGRSFHPAKLPVELHERSYTILDSSEGAVVLHVNHGDGRNDVGNVYISDASCTRFSLSLANNIRSASGECEFDRVYGIDGIYIANFRPQAMTHDVDGLGLNSAEAVQMDDDLERETEMDAYHRSRGRHKHESIVRTVISFDKGGVWQYLVAPTIDSRGDPLRCETAHCSLHLHGVTNVERFAPFYSVENAPGLVMGTGNIGDHLIYDDAQMNTYLSRDGGLNWVEAHKGAYIYEFGDHGGLVAMADDTHATNQVVFSWNEGQSWYDFNLGASPIEVDNIVIEPNSSATEMILYGTRGSNGILYHLDFDMLDKPRCRGFNSADSVSSDYEWWQPSDGRGSSCMLGREMKLVRRKQGAECFNGRDFARPKTVKNCECTKIDYECEVGFSRTVGTDECKPNTPYLTTEGCKSSKTFVTHAYRRVPGDTCTGGWKPEMVSIPCPHNAPLNWHARFIIFFLLGMAAVIGLFTAAAKHPRLRQFVSQYGFDTYASVKYSVLGHPDTSMDVTDRYQAHLGDLSDGEEEVPPEEIFVESKELEGRPGKRSSNTLELF